MAAQSEVASDAGSLPRSNRESPRVSFDSLFLGESAKSLSDVSLCQDGSSATPTAFMCGMGHLQWDMSENLEQLEQLLDEAEATYETQQAPRAYASDTNHKQAEFALQSLRAAGRPQTAPTLARAMCEMQEGTNALRIPTHIYQRDDGLSTLSHSMMEEAYLRSQHSESPGYKAYMADVECELLDSSVSNDLLRSRIQLLEESNKQLESQYAALLARISEEAELPLFHSLSPVPSSSAPLSSAPLPPATSDPVGSTLPHPTSRAGEASARPILYLRERLADQSDVMGHEGAAQCTGQEATRSMQQATAQSMQEGAGQGVQAHSSSGTHHSATCWQVPPRVGAMALCLAYERGHGIPPRVFGLTAEALWQCIEEWRRRMCFEGSISNHPERWRILDRAVGSGLRTWHKAFKLYEGGKAKVSWATPSLLQHVGRRFEGRLGAIADGLTEPWLPLSERCVGHASGIMQAVDEELDRKLLIPSTRRANAIKAHVKQRIAYRKQQVSYIADTPFRMAHRVKSVLLLCRPEPEAVHIEAVIS